MITKQKTRKAGPRSRLPLRPSTAPPTAPPTKIAHDEMVTESLANEPLLNLDAAVQVGDGMSVLSSGDLESITGDQDFSLPARRRSLSVRELIAIGLGQVELLSFRVGNEMFAIDLACVEEAVESDAVHAVPDMPEAMLGFIELRGRLVPVFSPSNVLCAQLSGTDGVTLLMRSGDRRVGIAVDDVEDVIVVDMPALRHPMLHNAGDGLLLGVAASGSGLVGILDGSALVAACTGHSFAEAV